MSEYDRKVGHLPYDFSTAQIHHGIPSNYTYGLIVEEIVTKNVPGTVVIRETTMVGLSFCLQNVSGSISKATNAKETIIAAVHAARSVFLCV